MSSNVRLLVQEGARVVVFFSCTNTSKFVGSAALAESSLEWICTNQVPYHMVRYGYRLKNLKYTFYVCFI